MIIFNKENYVFSYRVAGVTIHDNKVLVVKSIPEDYWYLPGGRCEFLEISSDALIREMKEEIGVDVKIIRPIYFVENFFNELNKEYHEVSIFYLIEFPPDSKLVFENDEFLGIEASLIFKWVDIDNIENLILYPQFLRKSLKNIKANPEHIINKDK